MEGVQPLLDGVDVVVHAAGGLAPVDETSGHGLVADVEVDDLGARGDLFLELLALSNFTWVTVNQESLGG